MDRQSSGLIGTLALALMALLALTGGATAADVTLANETVAVDGDTQSVYAEVNNSATANASLVVEFVGQDTSGNETWTDSRNVTVGADSTKMIERSDLNASAVDSVKVKATLDNSTVSSENVSVSTGAIQKVAGGSGGGFLDGSGIPKGALALAALFGIGILMRD